MVRMSLIHFNFFCLQLPLDLQERVKSHMTQEQIINMEDASRKLETRLIRVPMQTFPPTAMVYSINDHTNQSDEENKLANEESVPMTLIAKVLTQPEPTRKPRRTYICYKCKLDVVYLDKQVQTCGDIDRNGHVPANIKVHRSNSNRVRLNSTETDIMWHQQVIKVPHNSTNVEGGLVCEISST